MTNSTQNYRIVDEDNNIVDGLVGLSLSEAEHMLCRCLNHGADAYIQDEEPCDNAGSDAAIIKHITDLTHHNLHTEALIATAAYFKRNGLVYAFEHYLSEQAHMGYMTIEAISRRDDDKQRLLEHIALMRGTDTRKLFNSLL